MTRLINCKFGLLLQRTTTSPEVIDTFAEAVLNTYQTDLEYRPILSSKLSHFRASLFKSTFVKAAKRTLEALDVIIYVCQAPTHTGVNRMEHQPEIILIKPQVTSLDLSLFF